MKRVHFIIMYLRHYKCVTRQTNKGLLWWYDELCLFQASQVKSLNPFNIARCFFCLIWLIYWSNLFMKWNTCNFLWHDETDGMKLERGVPICLWLHPAAVILVIPINKKQWIILRWNCQSVITLCIISAGIMFINDRNIIIIWKGTRKTL